MASLAVADVGPLQQQQLSCWEDEPGFVGTSVKYLRRDGIEVQERIGFASGDRILHIFHNEMSVCLKAHGELTLGADGRIVALPIGSWLLMAGRDSTRHVELRVSPSLSGVQYAWSVDGVRGSFGDEGQALLALASEYWPYFARVAQASAEITRIGQELEALASAREDLRVRTLAEAEDRMRELERAVAELARGGLGQLAMITQDASTVTIMRKTESGEQTSVYNLDGSESRNLLSFGDESVEQVSRASWEGGRLLITSSVDLGASALETTMSLSFDSSGMLVVESSVPSGSGQPATSTKLYRRNND